MAEPFDETADEAGAADRPAIVKVLFALPLPRAYDYRARHALAPGIFVEAPLGGRLVKGVVWPGEPDGLDAARIKDIERVLPARPLGRDVVDFLAWVSHYTMFQPGQVLRLLMRSGDALETPQGVGAWRATGKQPSRLTEKRKAALDCLTGGAVMTAAEIAASCGASAAVIRGLADAGAVEKILVDPDPPFAAPDMTRRGVELSDEQERAAEKLRGVVGCEGTVLLDGVTGSGKTEVYLEAAAQTLRREEEAQVLILLPEISLTLAFLKRVEARFGAEPALWHSDMTAAARRRVWRRVNDGGARLVIGARSALFLPFAKLKLIIVDEEHDTAYKQEDGVIYQARDMAVARGARGGFPVILASATPSLESVVNVEQGRYDLVRLPSRFGEAGLPKITLVDMRHDGADDGKWLSPCLVSAVDARLAAKEQSLLFINRRGYAPVTICRRCGHRLKSPMADAFLVEHRFENRLVCHHSGFSMPKPAACPSCNAIDSLAACGPGVERVAEEVAARWPDARRAVLSSDLVRSPVEMRALLDAMRENEIDILVATQMIAKGHHFPNLTLVGVVDADMGLAGGDLRAAERTYQLLSQVSGRAGREQREGEAMLQTYLPDSPVFQALKNADRDAFLEAEAGGRAELGFPPYGRLAILHLRSENEKLLREIADAHREALFAADGVMVWGPAPAPIYRLRGVARLRFIIKTRRDVNVQSFIDAWIDKVRLPAAIRRVIDIDPYNFI